eukprot:scaffold1178_cov252-Pinguiococcus_pyrenoidosus.AAC.48
MQRSLRATGVAVARRVSSFAVGESESLACEVHGACELIALAKSSTFRARLSSPQTCLPTASSPARSPLAKDAAQLVPSPRSILPCSFQAASKSVTTSARASRQALWVVCALPTLRQPQPAVSAAPKGRT